MSERPVFQAARRFLLGETGVHLDIAEAQALAAKLTPAERGSLLSLYWANEPAVDSGSTARRILAGHLDHFELTPPHFDSAAFRAGLAALCGATTRAPHNLPANSQFDPVEVRDLRIAGKLRRMLGQSDLPPPEDTLPALRSLLPLYDHDPPEQRLALARLANDHDRAQSAKDALFAATKTPLALREWAVLLQTSPAVFFRLVVRDHPLAMPRDAEDEDHGRNPLLEQVPGYAAFAEELLTEAKARLAAIANGAAPYKADGAFPVNDCYVINAAFRYGLYSGGDWATEGLTDLWLQAATAPDPAAKTMPSQSLAIGFANATVAEPRPAALLALRAVASVCRHAGVKKKLDRFARAAQTALAAMPERVLDFDPTVPLEKAMQRPFRDAVETLLAVATPMDHATWTARFGPARPDGWKLAQGLIWQISLADGTRTATAMPRQKGKVLSWHMADDMAIALDDTATLRLWHPVETPDDLARLWRLRLEAEGASQPFLQAGREIYRPDPAEQQGRRIAAFAGHDVDGAALFGLSRVAGWRAGFQDELHLRLAGIRFVFHSGVRAAPIGGGGTTGALVLQGPQDRLAQIPARTLSEVMRRADLLVTVGKRAL